MNKLLLKLIAAKFGLSYAYVLNKQKNIGAESGFEIWKFYCFLKKHLNGKYEEAVKIRQKYWQ